ncbi:uncharacterized protein LJ206_000838 isoform 1-T1 [Theristicus caerulescens]
MAHPAPLELRSGQGAKQHPQGHASHAAAFPLRSTTNAPSSCLPFQAVDIGVGTFAVVPVCATVGEDQVLPVERPVFQPCRFLKKFYRLKCAKTKIPDETLSVALDFEQIAADIHFRRDIVEQCIHETLLFFAGALRDNKEVEFSFKGIGILAVRRKAVSMTFFDDCLLQLDATGNMLAALHGDSKMRAIVAFPGKTDFSRLSRDGVVTLPRLAVETPHQASAPVISLKPQREPAPWGRGARRVSVLDPVFLAQRRVSLARQLAKEGEQAKGKEAGPGSVLPEIQQKSPRELKQPRPPAQARLELPACVAQPSGTVRPGDLPALRHLLGSGPGQQRRQELPSVPALLPSPSPRRLTLHVSCVPGLQGTRSLRTQREEKRLRLLMASKRQELEAEAWRQYRAKRRGRETEQGQSPCRHLFEDPHRPPHLLRKAYAEKLMKEGLQEKERCQSPARQRASEERPELHLPGRARQDRGEKTRLLERRWKAQGLAATPRSCEQPRRAQRQGP